MKYSYNTLVYANEDITQGIERLAKFGYDFVDFVGEPAQHDVDKINQSLKENNIKASSICAIFNAERDLVSSNPAIRENTINYIKEVVDFAVAIGASYISVSATANMKIRPEADLETEKKWAVEGLKIAGEYALSKGIKLTLEAWNRYETYLVNRMEQALEIVNQVNLPSVGVMADTYHMNIDEDNIADALRLTGDKLYYVHIADSNRKAPGYGHIDFTEVARALRDINYDGVLSMELLPAAADPFMVLEGTGSPEFYDQYSKDSIIYLKKLFEEEK
jgi:sugar phosphate isomerase/epimerase